MQLYHPELKAQLWWKANDFPTTKALSKIFEAQKKHLSAELAALKSDPEAWSRSGELEQKKSSEATVDTDGNVAKEKPTSGVLHKTSLSYERVRSDHGTLGGWAEHALFDGIEWGSKQCKKYPSICTSLRSPATSLCSGVKLGLQHEDVDKMCGTDIVAAVVRLTRGTRILPHCGPTNRRLILHWCFEGCDGVEHTVGGVKVKDFGGGSGRPIIFDDSFEHGIEHNGLEDAYFVQAVLGHPSAK